ncbi:MAG: TetR/AcrR family transcriptional regulator [Actinomycetia bacterium]|nr:TetR/AcrR family transcriptional regulator [Actinomycetes bacterium]
MAAPTLRERQRTETRDAIERAALELVDERGVEQVTVRDIAAAAGISERTFFNHYATKEDALVSRPEWLIEATRAAIVDGTGSLLDDLEQACVQAVEAVSDERDGILATRQRVLRNNPTLFSSAIAAMHTDITLLIEAIEQRPDGQSAPEVSHVAALLTGTALMYGLGQWRPHEQHEPSTESVRIFFAALRSLCGDR